MTTDNINFFDEPNSRTDLKLRNYKNLNYGKEYSIRETNNKHLSTRELTDQYKIYGNYEK